METESTALNKPQDTVLPEKYWGMGIVFTGRKLLRHGLIPKSYPASDIVVQQCSSFSLEKGKNTQIKMHLFPPVHWVIPEGVGPLQDGHNAGRWAQTGEATGAAELNKGSSTSSDSRSSRETRWKAQYDPAVLPHCLRVQSVARPMRTDLPPGVTQSEWNLLRPQASFQKSSAW